MKTPLAIVGLGKMGCLVEQLAPEHGFEVRAKFTSSNIGTLSHESLRGATVAMEFSTPSTAPANLRALAALGVNTVCGTTGWQEHFASVQQAVATARTALVHGANFSVGVNLFFDVVVRAAELFAQHPEYEAWGWEIHHLAKKDAPSGTLKELSRLIRQSGYSREFPLSSSRAGAHPGTHEIGFDSPADTITLRHTSRSREGFARGALQAARWVQGKQGTFEFREILGELRGPGASGSLGGE